MVVMSKGTPYTQQSYKVSNMTAELRGVALTPVAVDDVHAIQHRSWQHTRR